MALYQTKPPEMDGDGAIKQAPIKPPPGSSDVKSNHSQGGSSGFGSLVNLGKFAMIPLKMDESFGSDLSLQEAIRKLQDLMKENHDLKNVLRDNNVMMNSLQTILVDMKNKWEAEQRQSMKKFEQAKSVVMNLRRDVEEKRARIQHLETQLVQNRPKSDSPVGGEGVEALYRELEQCKTNLSCMRREHEIQNNEMDNLRIKMEQAQKRAAATTTELEQRTAKVSELTASCEHKEDQMAALVAQNRKLVEAKKVAANEMREMEKRTADLQQQMEDLRLTVVPETSGTPESLTNVMRPSSAGVEDNAEATRTKYQDGKTGDENAEPSQAKRDMEKAMKHEKCDHGNVTVLLQQEKQNVANLTAQMEQLRAMLEASNHELQSKSQSLDLLQQAMDGRMKQIESIHIQKEGELLQQLDTLHRQLQHSMGHQSHMPENIDTLKAQVLSLLNELTESNRKHQEMCLVADRYKQKSEELEDQYVATQDQLGSLRSKDDHLIDALRGTVADTERALASQKEKNEEQSGMIEEYRMKLQELQKDISVLKYKLDEAKSQSPSRSPGGSIVMTVAEKRGQDEKLGRLTAQLMTAEDSLLQRQEEIQKLQQKVMLLRQEQEDIPYLKAQINSYKQDFEVECKARQEDKKKLAGLREELATMQLFNQQLHDQLDQLSSQERRAEVRDISRSRPYPGGGYDECDLPEALRTNDHASPRSWEGPRSWENQRTLVEGRSDQGRPDVGQGRSDLGQGQSDLGQGWSNLGQGQSDLGHIHRVPSSHQSVEYVSSGSRQPTEHDATPQEDQAAAAAAAAASAHYQCPKCGLKTQDIDSLTIHVDDCLKDSEC